MYEHAKWTTEAARFSRIIIQAFWALELGTYAVFSFLLVIRPTSPRYGVYHMAEVTHASFTPINLLAEGLPLCAVLVALTASKFTKRGLGRGTTTALAVLACTLIYQIVINELTLFRALLT